MRLLSTLAMTLTLLTVIGCGGQKPAEQPIASSPVSDVTPVTTATYKPEPMPVMTTVVPPAPEVAMTTPTGPSAGNTHVVKKGETFYSLAKLHYGNGKQWQRIASANPGVTPSSLKVGQTLIIP